MRYHAYIFYLLLLNCSISYGHTLRGIIVDAMNGQILPHALIQIEELGTGAVSNADGTFLVDVPELGNYTLVYTYLGYEPLVQQVEVVKKETNLGQLLMRPSPREWDGMVVVTAQRDGRDLFSTSEAVSVLRAHHLDQNGARSMAEALIGMPGVWMQKTNHGGGSPFVRGLTGNQTLLLLDGIRLNNSTYRYGPNQYFNTIDALNVSQVEVVRGAGAVLYGSDALGGTVQVLSKSPRFSTQGRQWNGSAYGKWMSKGMEYSGRGELEFSGERAAFQGGFSYRDFGNLVAGGDLGVEAPSAYKEQARDFKGLLKTGTNSLLTLAYNGVFQSNVGRYDQVAQRGYELHQFDPQNRQMAYIRWQHYSVSPIWRAFNLTASLQHNLEGRQSRKTGSLERLDEEDRIRTLGLVAEWVAQPQSAWRIVSGVEFYSDRVESSGVMVNVETGLSTPRRGLYPNDAQFQSIALFTSHTFDWKSIKLNTGLRLNFFEMDIQDNLFGDTRITPVAIVGNVSARYALTDEQAVIAAVNTGFRAPNINDMSSFGSFDFGIEVPAIGLDPERSLTFELGYKLQLKQISGSLALYRTQLYDLIGRVRATYNGSDTYRGEDVYKKKNIAEAFLQGVETDWNWALNSRWNLFSTLIYTYGQDREKEEPMRRIPPLNGRIGINYQTPKRFFGQAELWYAGQQNRLSSGDISDHRIAKDGTPGWMVVNVKSGYQWSWMQFHLGIQNLFNEAYRIHGSGVDGLGRSWWLGTRISF